jgi:hypothetical protein
MFLFFRHLNNCLLLLMVTAAERTRLEASKLIHVLGRREVKAVAPSGPHRGCSRRWRHRGPATHLQISPTEVGMELRLIRGTARRNWVDVAGRGAGPPLRMVEPLLSTNLPPYHRSA